MTQKKKPDIPKIASEPEDAQWRDRQRRELQSEMVRRLKEESKLAARRATVRAKSAPGRKII